MAVLSQIRLRPSQGPVAKYCPSSMYAPDGGIEIQDPPTVFSNVGVALHKIFEDLIHPGKEINADVLTPYSKRFDVTMDGYFGIHWRTNQMQQKWIKISQWYQDARREERIECTLKNGFRLGGSPDLWQVYGDYAVIFDLKTGEADIDYYPQVELYALILWKLNGALGLQKVHTALFCPMLEKYESRVFDAQYLSELEDRYIEAMEASGVIYRPGPHCRLCRRLTACPTVIRAVDPLCAEIQAGREIVPGDIARMRPAVAVMEKIVERYKAVEKGLLERFGTIDLGNGYELYIKTIPSTAFIPQKTVAILLNEGIPMDAIVARMQFTKADIKELARKSPKMIPRHREKGLGATQGRLLTTLENEGATEDHPRKQVAQRVIPDHQIAQEE